MKFILHEIRIWFKKDQEPRVLKFEPNKVNVITGDSGSGKTNILAIIDYCLLSKNSNIVEEVISENAEWYSVRFTLNESNVFIARRKLDQDTINSEICIFIDKEMLGYPVSNISLEEGREKLDELFNITDKIRYPFKKEKGIYPLRISYRTYLLYSYLTERIITLDNVFLDFDYFEETMFGDYKQYLVGRALGFDDGRRKKLQEELDLLKKGKVDFDKEQVKNQKNNRIFIETLKGFVFKLRDHNILSDIEDLTEPLEIIEIIKSIISQFEKNASLEQGNEQLRKLKKEYNVLRFQYKNIQQAELDIKDYNAHIERYKDSLQPIAALKLKSNEIARSYETQQLVDALERSLFEIKKADLKKVSQTLVSPTEKERLNNQLKKLEEEIKTLTPNKNFRDRTPSQYMLIANIKRDLYELLKKQSNLLDIKDSYIENYIEKCSDYEQAIDKEKGAKPALEYAVNQSIQSFYNQLEYMGNYTDNDIMFNWEKFVVQLKKSGKKYPHRNLGSKSNYMFLHLCLFLGFHRHFYSLPEKFTIPFLFIDQPSIPYYAGSENVNNDDKEKLFDAFKLLDNFITTMNEYTGNDFQILLIEHAPKSYWEGILNNFYTVEEFTQGNKLIPQRIINPNAR